MKLGIRRRNFLFFALIAIGCCLALGFGFWASARNADAGAVNPLNLVLIAGFGILGVIGLAWLLVDERVVKPLIQLATEMRARAENDIVAPINTKSTQHLDDIAPAAAALHLKSTRLTDAIAAATSELEAENRLLCSVLSDLPIATIILGETHRIALYDRQAAEVLARIAPPRLHSSIFDYFDSSGFLKLSEKLDDNQQATTTLKDKSGTKYKNVRIKHIAESGGYLIMIEPQNEDFSLHIERPIVFNFELLEAKPARSLADTPLSEIDFTVFDTETTGLDPKQHELIQIGGVRIVRGAIVDGETFDKYIKPSAPIPALSTRVHGITDDYVADAEAADKVIEQFLTFSRDTLLAAHNAPFDWQFLTRATNVPKQPILDTVLVSAILYGRTEKHSLDALCARLHITIPETQRHTAIGDSIATAKALCAAIPMLDAKGVRTFGDYQKEAEKFSRLLAQVT